MCAGGSLIDFSVFSLRLNGYATRGGLPPPFDRTPLGDETQFLDLEANETLEAVMKSVQQLGYDLSPEDGLKVYEAYKAIAEKKGRVSRRELDAIVATSALRRADVSARELHRQYRKQHHSFGSFAPAPV